MDGDMERMVVLTAGQAGALSHAARLVAQHLDPPPEYLLELVGGTLAMANAFGIEVSPERVEAAMQELTRAKEGAE